MKLEQWHKSDPFTSVISLPRILKFLSFDAYAAFHALCVLRENIKLCSKSQTETVRPMRPEHTLSSRSCLGFVSCVMWCPSLPGDTGPPAGWLTCEPISHLPHCWRWSRPSWQPVSEGEENKTQWLELGVISFCYFIFCRKLLPNPNSDQ